MKKFLIYLAVIIVMVATGFTIFVLVRDDEYMSLTVHNPYINVGDEVTFDFVHENAKSYTKVNIRSYDGKLTPVAGKANTFVAERTGMATVMYETNNPRFGVLTCDVFIGDGSSAISPYYITNAEQLSMIGVVTGTDTEGENVYKFEPNAYYSIQNDIDLTQTTTTNDTGYWLPIGSGSDIEFTGRIDGNGYKLSNLRINGEAYNEAITTIDPDANPVDFTNVGLIATIGQGGKVQDVILENVTIDGDYAYAGSVAAINRGTVERVRVENFVLNGSTRSTNNVGGIVGYNNSSLGQEVGDVGGEQYSGTAARIDRCYVTVSSMGTIEEPLYGQIGGLAGRNNAGIVINSYVKTVNINRTQDYDVYIASNSDTKFGGLVGYNTYLKKVQFGDNGQVVGDLTDGTGQVQYAGGNIKDCYVLLTVQSGNTQAHIGMIAGVSSLSGKYNVTGDVTRRYNKIYGNYYCSNPYTEYDSTYTAFGKEINGTDIADSAITYKDGVIDTTNKTQYEYLSSALARENMRKKSSYISHIYLEDNIVTWKFENVVWYLDGTGQKNNGYPYLNFQEQAIADDFDNDGAIIGSQDDLTNIDKDGTYVIDSEIVLDETWQPIGTADEPFTGSITMTDNGWFVGKNGVVFTQSIVGYLGEGASLKNVKVKNYNIRSSAEVLDNNGNMLGVLVESNSGVIDGAEIVDCNITLNVAEVSMNSNSFSTGIVAGVNEGSILNTRVTDSNISVENKTQSTTVTQGPEGENVEVTTDVADTMTRSLALGGIAGTNLSNISGSIFANKVGTGLSVGNVPEGATDRLTVNAGGIAGDTSGTITYSYFASTIDLPYAKDNKNAGGIAGLVQGSLQYNESTGSYFAKIENCGVFSGNISAYTTGGLIGIINTTGTGTDKFIKVYDWVTNNQTSANYDMSVNYDVVKSYVEDSSIAGIKAGGLVGHAKQTGAFKWCYIDGGTIRGNEHVSANSVIGGFAGRVEPSSYDMKKSTEFRGTIFASSYCNVSFGTADTVYALVEGKNILIMPTTVLTQWLFSKKESALVVDCLYNADNGGSIDSENTGNAKTNNAGLTSQNGNIPSAFSNKIIATDKNAPWLYINGDRPRIAGMLYGKIENIEGQAVVVFE